MRQNLNPNKTKQNENQASKMKITTNQEIRLHKTKNKITWNSEWFRVHMAAVVVPMCDSIRAINHGSYQSICNN